MEGLQPHTGCISTHWKMIETFCVRSSIQKVRLDFSCAVFGHFFFFFLNGQIAAISFLDTVKQKNRMDNYVKIILLQLFILICNIVNFNNLNPSNSSYVKSISRNISFCVVNSRMDFLNSTPERREHFRGYSRVLRCTCRTRQREKKTKQCFKTKTSFSFHTQRRHTTFTT